jgi:hypothetical protein
LRTLLLIINILLAVIHKFLLTFCSQFAHFLLTFCTLFAHFLLIREVADCFGKLQDRSGKYFLIAGKTGMNYRRGKSLKSGTNLLNV